MQDINSKWGKKIAERGFTQIPNYLLYLNMFVDDDIKLSASETIVLIHLISNWWNKEDMPYPSMQKISERSGISIRQVQRALKSLEEKEFIEKKKRKINKAISSNAYDLTPTIEILNLVANQFKNKYPRKIKEIGDKT
jgi:DNA-binding transcriptional regulator YhcF (GntR family)